MAFKLRSGNTVPFKKMGSKSSFKFIAEAMENAQEGIGGVLRGEFNKDDALAEEAQRASDLEASGNTGQAMSQQMGGGKDITQRTHNLEKKVGQIVNYLDQGAGGR
mgnify:FL=1|tara:strand:+ start:1523 stop:1840 length:318 start_codon:yes stop_codon:yes gene_type:complete